MKQYHDMMHAVFTDDTSTYKPPDRTNVGTIALFGIQAKYKLSEGYPIVTTKKLHIPTLVHEMIWFLSGNTNIRYLTENKVRIWNEWADADGNLGPIYGYQWRSWPGYDGGSIDQLKKVVDNIKTHPNSRRHIVSAWNVAQLDKMALAPCHLLFQMGVNKRNGEDELDLLLYQRSADIFLGVPFNIAEYGLLTHLIANETGLKPGILVHTIGDAHIYCGAGETGVFFEKNLDKIKDIVRKVGKREDYLIARDEILDMMKSSGLSPGLEGHVSQCLELLSREPKPLPKLILDERAGINNLLFDYVKIEGYDAHPHIKGIVAV